MRANVLHGLGDDATDSSIGPLSTVDIPAFSMDPNLLLAGVGILGLAFVLNIGGRKVRTYSRDRKRRSRRRRELKEELRRL